MVPTLKLNLTTIKRPNEKEIEVEINKALQAAKVSTAK